MLGMALANQLGPFWVTTGGDTVRNSTLQNSDLDLLRESLSNYLITQSVFLMIILIAVTIHFPSKPKVKPHLQIYNCHLSDYGKLPQTAPSTIGEGNRLKSMRHGLISLLGNKSALACVFAYSISIGIEGHWIGVIQINYEKYGVPEKQVGQMVLFTVLVTTTIGIVLSK